MPREGLSSASFARGARSAIKRRQKTAPDKTSARRRSPRETTVLWCRPTSRACPLTRTRALAALPDAAAGGIAGLHGVHPSAEQAGRNRVAATTALCDCTPSWG
eukprot:scaffold10552_cov111-Isochrysis_galbana.AAC.3